MAKTPKAFHELEQGDFVEDGRCIMLNNECIVTTAGRELFRGILTREQWVHLQRSYPACTLHVTVLREGQ